ncbi:MAG TPA: ribonuclease III [Clostridiales bacterium]|nr:ribonuclease III [Clostridiales bacterium]HQP70949.1 ribonuclease III [Clostridiales bacterium]
MFGKLLSFLNFSKKNNTLELPVNIGELEFILGHKFKNKELLIRALTHRSYSAQDNGNGESNERLEFLGDSVLSFIVAEYLFINYKDKPEGDLSKMRSILVSGENLCRVARDISLGKFILVSEFEERSGGRDKDSLLEDCMESVIGAVYSDSGIEKARELINRIILDNCGSVIAEKKNTNYKSELLELVQSFGIDPPRYEIIREEGPEHDKTFTVSVIVKGETLAEGKANSKKKAEQIASSNALDRINGNPDILK